MSKKIFTKNKIKYSGKFKICFIRNGESLFNKLFSVISVTVALKWGSFDQLAHVNWGTAHIKKGSGLFVSLEVFIALKKVWRDPNFIVSPFKSAQNAFKVL